MNMPAIDPEPKRVMTVTGPVPFKELGVTDAHNHVWIEPSSCIDENAPVLNQFPEILAELKAYKEAGGKTILDCQPYGCGRNGNKLHLISTGSGVQIIAATGFHKQQYYPREFWLWQAGSQKVSDFFCAELGEKLFETEEEQAIRAGFIKIALESSWKDCPEAQLQGASSAAYIEKALIEIHTEKGALAEEIVRYLLDRKISPHQIVLCHMDKRPDLGLHRALARSGVLLEYDTFFRPKYSPDKNVWPLIKNMVKEGLSKNIALATDMADSNFYHFIGGGVGLASLPRNIQNKLKQLGVPKVDRQQMLGGNIARRLAGKQ
jgi:phosphotriesterase-related protein